jgi:hypothetical protein
MVMSEDDPRFMKRADIKEGVKRYQALWRVAIAELLGWPPEEIDEYVAEVWHIFKKTPVLLLHEDPLRYIVTLLLPHTESFLSMSFRETSKIKYALIDSINAAGKEMGSYEFDWVAARKNVDEVLAFYGLTRPARGVRPKRKRQSQRKKL